MKKWIGGAAVMMAVVVAAGILRGQAAEKLGVNLGPWATPGTSFVSGHETLGAINDGIEPKGARDHTHGAYGNWPQRGKQWVEYVWTKPVSTNGVDVYWWEDGQGVHLPTASRVLYWDGAAYVPVPEASGLGVAGGKWNTTRFKEVTTTKLRLEFEGDGTNSTGIIEWKVYDSGKSPAFPPVVEAGIDRVTVLPGKTYLNGRVKGPAMAMQWGKASGPGEVTFEKADAAATAATFSTAGEYVLKLTAGSGEETGAGTVRVRVEAESPAERLEPVYTRAYTITSPLMAARAKALIVNWIPHCIAEMEDPGMQTADRRVRQPTGGIDNFIEAGKKLRGEPAKPHVGYVFSNAWVLNTVESICVALQVDPQGDAEVIAAQKQLRAKLEEWIPIILAAQEPDGYLQTRFTLGFAREQGRAVPGHWTVKGDHEGYVAGYFVEAAIAHYLLTNGDDRRLYDAAKRMADCWCEHLGPAPKKAWYDGHQEMEQALVRFGRFVNDMEGGGKGDKYVALAKFLLDQRKNGEEYDQSHLPVVQQYEAVGHAVRASYTYSAMADVATETRDLDYQSAVKSLWDNLVNRKWYVTGGIGSGETSEGFGKDYSLRNNAYCESCSNCGALFFQWKLNLAYHDAKYADLYEGTFYNAILGDVDLAGKNFCYTNALDTAEARYPWHTCPCCIGNIPRTLLMLPTWMYSTGKDALYVNMYVGSKVNVQRVAGTSVQMVQATDYPWNGDIAITVNPETTKTFALKLRIPNRSISDLYQNAPDTGGLVSLKINGQPVTPLMERGYAVLSREWHAGDKIEMALPMAVRRVTAIDAVAATRGRVALAYGPLVYNIESVDGSVDRVLAAGTALKAEWKPELLGGVMAITGAFADGSPLLAVPNYARLNRGGRSVVWIRDR